MHYNTKNRKFPYTTTKSHKKTGRNKPKSPPIYVEKKKRILFTPLEFTLANFISIFKQRFKENNTYTLLIAIGFNNETVTKMAGNQIGVVNLKTFDSNYYEEIYNTILSRIEWAVSKYNDILSLNFNEM